MMIQGAIGRDLLDSTDGPLAVDQSPPRLSLTVKLMHLSSNGKDVPLH